MLVEVENNFRKTVIIIEKKKTKEIRRGKVRNGKIETSTPPQPPNTETNNHVEIPLNIIWYVIIFHSRQTHRLGKTITFRVQDVRCILKPYHLHLLA